MYGRVSLLLEKARSLLDLTGSFYGTGARKRW